MLVIFSYLNYCHVTILIIYIQNELKSCRWTSQLAGLPFAGATVGISYLLRHKLNIGNGGFPFYALLGVGTLTLYGIIGSNNCSALIKSSLESLQVIFIIIKFVNISLLSC